ncbi:hypothetical protein BCR44DRAFT_1070758 [Catenaria anguillulae PL171]|uniref:Uncharacterized protein n=1 Tax=Catenaria anguillulae PL171 TaxID=765915 RepID=A0A1Y2H8Z9_9FUNG|nr:hypothetical protein BCR44DRAFT_1070758 [Catenaria anguillulae PL171]
MAACLERSDEEWLSDESISATAAFPIRMAGLATVEQVKHVWRTWIKCDWTCAKVTKARETFLRNCPQKYKSLTDYATLVAETYVSFNAIGPLGAKSRKSPLAVEAEHLVEHGRLFNLDSTTDLVSNPSMLLTRSDGTCFYAVHYGSIPMEGHVFNFTANHGIEEGIWRNLMQWIECFSSLVTRHSSSRPKSRPRRASNRSRFGNLSSTPTIACRTWNRASHGPRPDSTSLTRPTWLTTAAYSTSSSTRQFSSNPSTRSFPHPTRLMSSRQLSARPRVQLSRGIPCGTAHHGHFANPDLGRTAPARVHGPSNELGKCGCSLGMVRAARDGCDQPRAPPVYVVGMPRAARARVVGRVAGIGGHTFQDCRDVLHFVCVQGDPAWRPIQQRCPARKAAHARPRHWPPLMDPIRHTHAPACVPYILLASPPRLAPSARCRVRTAGPLPAQRHPSQRPRYGRLCCVRRGHVPARLWYQSYSRTSCVGRVRARQVLL